MKNRGWIFLGVGAVVAAFIALNLRLSTYSTDYDDIESAANDTADWGTRQRITGVGENLFGKMKETYGRVTGDHDVAEDGVLDQITGAAKDTAGRAAHVVSDAIHDLNR